jgi:heme A synthase
LTAGDPAVCDAVVGAGWLLVSRYGGRPLDFGDAIVELTAIHFHCAGLVAPLLVLSLIQWLRLNGKNDSAATASLVAVLVVTPLTAVGITFEPALGTAGAAAFAGGLLTTSLLTLRRVIPQDRGASRMLLAISRRFP